MISHIYVEAAVREHPRTVRILRRFSSATVVACERYGEVFNPRAQNFRLQKRRPALILAEKFDNHVLPAPPGYGIGGARNYYFSHMLNCVYDCRYCFLQGMYRSANYVLFVNFDDFKTAILETLKFGHGDRQTFFFSGYDCDSLAFEPISGFAEAFLPFFRRHPEAILELRTKSLQVQTLLESPPTANCVVAFSLTPDPVARALEHRAPPVRRRLATMKTLAERGWPLGLRFDPLIYHHEFRTNYERLFQQVFAALPATAIHSISIGALRFPRQMFATLTELYPRERLFASGLQQGDTMVSYPSHIEREMVSFCRIELSRYVPRSILFTCHPGMP